MKPHQSSTRLQVYELVTNDHHSTIYEVTIDYITQASSNINKHSINELSFMQFILSKDLATNNTIKI